MMPTASKTFWKLIRESQLAKKTTNLFDSNAYNF
jgi:hypothetical protein